MKQTMCEYQEYLNNTIHFDYESDEWIIGGKRREYYAARGLYGTALRSFDKNAFYVGYNEWKRSCQLHKLSSNNIIQNIKKEK